jgi:hypothetical protein
MPMAIRIIHPLLLLGIGGAMTAFATAHRVPLGPILIVMGAALLVVSTVSLVRGAMRRPRG